MKKEEQAKLNCRLPLYLKKALEAKAKMSRRNISDYLRILIEKDVSTAKTLQFGEIEIIGEEDNE